MIEFKADCGHTVRARDENAGGVVRCSYCGKESAVPDARNDDLDFLFEDLENIEPAGGKPRKKKSRSLFRPSRPGKPFDPFAVILKLCYAAALISIVIVVGRKFVVPWFSGTRPQPIVARKSQERGVGMSTETAIRRQSRATGATVFLGLDRRTRPKGLFVSSTPGGALGFYINADRAPVSGRINRTRGVTTFTVGDENKCSKAGDGEYVVEIAMPWNDPGLTRFRGYTDFRRSIEHAPDAERRRLANKYFLPDESAELLDVFIDETSDQIYIVRQYRNVEIHGKRSRGVRALFLPRLMRPGTRMLEIEEIVLNYLPEGINYRFDEQHVMSELDYHRVPEQDQKYLVMALKRIGMMPYLTPDGKTRLFKIDIHNGQFSSKVISDS